MSEVSDDCYLAGQANIFISPEENNGVGVFVKNLAASRAFAAAADSAHMDQSDIKNFVADIMSFLTEEDMIELNDKAGVRFPLEGHTWSDLCYVCCWVGLKRPLPDSIYNRMMLGEPNEWVELYVKVKTKEPQPREKMTVEEFFNLAG